MVNYTSEAPVTEIADKQSTSRWASRRRVGAGGWGGGDWRIVDGSISGFKSGFTSGFKRFTVISMTKRSYDTIGDPSELLLGK